MEIRMELTETPKAKPTDESQLGFGSVFTDHMLVMNYAKGKGWYDPRIVPYAPIPIWPAASVLHYSQTVFEGLKAYRDEDGRILLFRPEENFRRLNESNRRLCIPEIDETLLLDSLKKLLEVEKDWVPRAAGTSLYIRPFVIAVDNILGVHPAHEYLYMVILSPSGAYYKQGLNPVKIYVEGAYVRAARGGTGTAKTGGNYAASLKAQDEANRQGYSQVLWLDGIERRYIEEVGAMNVFFVVGDEVITPALNGSILPGITRKSAIQLLEGWGYKVSQRKVSIDELAEAHGKGLLKEAFGTGTAAVVSPIGELKFGDTIMDLGGTIGPLTQRLYDNLTGIQYGRLEDPYNWSVEVCK
mgnify:CR=1 FL=1